MCVCVLVSFFIAVTNSQGGNLKEEAFSLGHSLSGFMSWVADSSAFKALGKTELHGKKMVLT
jgi:hypothetical protein